MKYVMSVVERRQEDSEECERVTLIHEADESMCNVDIELPNVKVMFDDQVYDEEMILASVHLGETLGMRFVRSTDQITQDMISISNGDVSNIELIDYVMTKTLDKYGGV